MFSVEDANQLRKGLEPFSFYAKKENSDLAKKYRAHYGLDFGSSESPAQLAIQHAIGTIESGQFTLVCHHFSISASAAAGVTQSEQTRKGTIFLLHGYLDHSGIYQHLIRHCLELKFDVVIFDLPGHGLSSGEPASIDSFFRYQEAFRDCLREAESQNVTRPWSVIAQSTGAAVLIDSLLNPRYVFNRARLSEKVNSAQDYERLLNFEHMILLAPLLRPSHWSLNKISFAIGKWFVKSLSRGFATNSHDKEFLNFLRYKDPLQSQRMPVDWVGAMTEYLKRFTRAGKHEQSLHVIQGTSDGTVDWKYNIPKLQSKFPNSEVHFVDKARHHLVNESNQFRGEVFSHIEKILD